MQIAKRIKHCILREFIIDLGMHLNYGKYLNKINKVSAWTKNLGNNQVASFSPNPLPICKFANGQREAECSVLIF